MRRHWAVSALCFIFCFLLWPDRSAATVLPGGLEPEAWQPEEIVTGIESISHLNKRVLPWDKWNKRRVSVALYHRGERSVGESRQRLGYAAFHWAILVEPKNSRGRDVDAYDVTDTILIDPVTKKNLNPELKFRFQAKHKIDPKRSRALLGRVVLGKLEKDVQLDQIFAALPLPNKRARPPQSCFDWAKSAISQLQVRGMIRSFDITTFTDWALDYADKRLAGAEVADVLYYDEKEEKKQMEKEKKKKQASSGSGETAVD